MKYILKARHHNLGGAPEKKITVVIGDCFSNIFSVQPNDSIKVFTYCFGSTMYGLKHWSIFSQVQPYILENKHNIKTIIFIFGHVDVYGILPMLGYYANKKQYINLIKKRYKQSVENLQLFLTRLKHETGIQYTDIQIIGPVLNPYYDDMPRLKANIFYVLDKYKLHSYKAFKKSKLNKNLSYTKKQYDRLIEYHMKFNFDRLKILTEMLCQFCKKYTKYTFVDLHQPLQKLVENKKYCITLTDLDPIKYPTYHRYIDPLLRLLYCMVTQTTVNKSFVQLLYKDYVRMVNKHSTKDVIPFTMIYNIARSCRKCIVLTI